MKRIAWLTDIHLNFVGTSQIDQLLRQVNDAYPDVVIISGDIGEARSLEDYLLRIAHALRRPIYFVLGNHDFYYGSLAEGRALAARLSGESPWLRWLPLKKVVELSHDTALIGHDTWSDGRLGDYARSTVELNDFWLIGELTGLDRGKRLDKLHALGDEAADYFRRVLPEALELYPHVFVVTHVPPFQEACWHNGHLSDDDYLPHFTCKAVGDVLRSLMQQYPQRQMTVLCGHTHGAGQAVILPNLRVFTGGAEYGLPTVQQIFEVR